MLLDGFTTEVVGGNPWGENGRELTNALHRAGVGVDAEDVVTGAHEVYEIPAIAAAGVEDPRARTNSAAQDLVEQVNIDVAELVLDGWRHDYDLTHCGAFSARRFGHVKIGGEMKSAALLVTALLAGRAFAQPAPSPAPAKQPTHAAPGLAPDRAARITQLLDRYVEENRIAGAVALVLRDGRPV